MKNFIPILLFGLFFVTTSSYINFNDQFSMQDVEKCDDKVTNQDFMNLARRYGYKPEEHTIITEDGYIFNIFRIRATFLSPEAEGKPPVLVGHGIMSSADIWGLYNRSLGYALADAGFDVWLGNSRGNSYGRLHKRLSPEEPRFWNFSWHEIGKLDYASTIDYILNKTNKPNLTLIGYSMGGTASLVLLSERPEYNQKINVLINLAPSVFLRNQDAMRAIFFNILYQLKDIIDPNEMIEFLPQGNALIRLAQDICKDLLDFCGFIFQLITGHDRRLHDKKEIMFASYFYPSGSSARCLWHYCQMALSGKFQQYDFGRTRNLLHYGQNNPPAYNLSNVKVDMVIFKATRDYFSTKNDIEEINNDVSSNVTVETVNHPTFSHLDFVIAYNVKNLVYDRIAEIINEYNK
ncbi:lipase 3-like [Chelonus insularis]|uniref:lipase 3-like n=1 Tax=Chelonus insularis TaxID=460826 RepID=UPI0015889AFB|nr:lipase 3-like [Chelonus insularis]